MSESIAMSVNDLRFSQNSISKTFGKNNRYDVLPWTDDIPHIVPIWVVKFYDEYISYNNRRLYARKTISNSDIKCIIWNRNDIIPEIHTSRVSELTLLWRGNHEDKEGIFRILIRPKTWGAGIYLRCAGQSPIFSLNGTLNNPRICHGQFFEEDQEYWKLSHESGQDTFLNASDGIIDALNKLDSEIFVGRRFSGNSFFHNHIEFIKYLKDTSGDEMNCIKYWFSTNMPLKASVELNDWDWNTDDDNDEFIDMEQYGYQLEQYIQEQEGEENELSKDFMRKVIMVEKIKEEYKELESKNVEQHYILNLCTNITTKSLLRRGLKRALQEIGIHEIKVLNIIEATSTIAEVASKSDLEELFKSPIYLKFKGKKEPCVLNAVCKECDLDIDIESEDTQDSNVIVHIPWKQLAEEDHPSEKIQLPKDSISVLRILQSEESNRCKYLDVYDTKDDLFRQCKNRSSDKSKLCWQHRCQIKQ